MQTEWFVVSWWFGLRNLITINEIMLKYKCITMGTFSVMEHFTLDLLGCPNGFWVLYGLQCLWDWLSILYRGMRWLGNLGVSEASELLICMLYVCTINSVKMFQQIGRYHNCVTRSYSLISNWCNRMCSQVDRVTE